MDMFRTADDVPDQAGRAVLATGANSGIGFEAAKGLAAKGATVVLLARLPVVPAQPPAMGALATLQAAAGSGVEGNDYFGPNGPFELGGTPSRSRRSPVARSQRVAERLWDESVELTGVTYDLAG